LPVENHPTLKDAQGRRLVRAKPHSAEAELTRAETPKRLGPRTTSFR
jgi:hypothetical protein